MKNILLLFLIVGPSVFSQEIYKVNLQRKNQYFGALMKMKLRVNDKEVRLKRKGTYEFESGDKIRIYSDHLFYKKKVYDISVSKDTVIYLKYGFSLFHQKPKVVTG